MEKNEGTLKEAEVDGVNRQGVNEKHKSGIVETPGGLKSSVKGKGVTSQRTVLEGKARGKRRRMTKPESASFQRLRRSQSQRKT